MSRAEIAKRRRQRRHGELVVVAARLLVAVRLAVPMPAEAQHAHVHLSAAADNGHVTRHRAIHQRAAGFDDGTLLGEGEMVFEVKGPARDLHNGYVIIAPDETAGHRRRRSRGWPSPARHRHIPFRSATSICA